MKLKVFGGNRVIRARGWVRCVVAATSQRRAAEIAGVSAYHFRRYWHQTGNQAEIKAAMVQPEVLLVAKPTVEYVEVDQCDVTTGARIVR